MLTLTEEQGSMILESTVDYKNSSRHKYIKTQNILEKILNNNLVFDSSEASIMFEYLAGYVSSKFPSESVEELRELLRPYKFPNDNTAKQ